MGDSSNTSAPPDPDATSFASDAARHPHLTRLINLVFGRPLASQEQEETKIGPLAGVPAMGLDGLTGSADKAATRQARKPRAKKAEGEVSKPGPKPRAPREPKGAA